MNLASTFSRVLADFTAKQQAPLNLRLRFMLKLNAKQLRKSKPQPGQGRLFGPIPIYIVLDNVLDTYNVGGLFRLADAVGAREVILCGETETPPSHKIHKSAVGLEEWIPWRYEKNARIAISNLKFLISNLSVVAVEQGKGSTPYTKLDKQSLFHRNKIVSSFGKLRTSERSAGADVPPGNFGVVLVLGHETKGVSQNVLKMADLVVEIPLFGVNRSLNVIVAAGIVLYKILENKEQRT